MKIAGIITSIVAAAVFVFLYFGRPHTVINAILVMLAGGLGIASIGMMGLSSEGQAGFVLAVKITAVGLAIAGTGIILNKLKERVTFDNHTL